MRQVQLIYLNSCPISRWSIIPRGSNDLEFTYQQWSLGQQNGQMTHRPSVRSFENDIPYCKIQMCFKVTGRSFALPHWKATQGPTKALGRCSLHTTIRRCNAFQEYKLIMAKCKISPEGSFLLPYEWVELCKPDLLLGHLWLWSEAAGTVSIPKCQWIYSCWETLLIFPRSELILELNIERVEIWMPLQS